MAISSFIMFASNIHAQGTVNVTLNGIPPLLPSPNISELITGYETGRYTMQVLYSSPNQIPTDFRLKLSIHHNGALLVTTDSEPITYAPGVYFYSNFSDFPSINFQETFSALIQKLPSGFRESANRGILPEGLYQLTIEVIPIDLNSGILSLPSNSFFTVQYSQPPVLFAPAHDAVVSVPQPIFSWTPVATPPNISVIYNLIIAEITGRQTPLQAIEGATFPLVETDLNDQTVFILTSEYLPLENGKTYAWQVTVSDPFDSFPFDNDGRSEIQTFTYLGSGGSADDIDLLTEIIVQPGFAKLMFLNEVSVDENPFSYQLNGPASLEMIINGEPLLLPVQLVNLNVQKTGLENPVLLNGAFFSNDISLVKQILQMHDFLDLNMLTWEFGSGFNLKADMTLPNGITVPMDGDLRIMPITGLTGSLTSSRQPVTWKESSGHRIQVNEISLHYPGNYMQVDGEILLFNGDLSCPAEFIDFSENGISAWINCDEFQKISLTPDDDGLSLHVYHGSGQIELGWDDDLQTLDISLMAGVGIDLLEDTNCSINGSLRLGTEGINFTNPVSTCTSGLGLNIGFAKLNLHQLQEKTIQWLHNTGWNISLAISGDIILPFNVPDLNDFNPGFRLPITEEILITKDGITIPALDLSEFDLESSPYFNIARFRVKASLFRLRETLFRWTEITKVLLEPGEGKPDLPGSWDFDFEGMITFDPAELSNQIELPGCFGNATMLISNGRFQNGAFTATIDGNLDGEEVCKFPLTPSIGNTEGLALEISSIGGDVTGSMQGLMFDTRVNLRTNTRITGTPFATCNNDNSAAEGQLFINANGIPSGSLQVDGPGCSIGLGPYSAHLTEGTIEISYDDEVKAELATGISVRYETGDGDLRSANGFFRADLMNQTILDLDATLQGPVGFNLPAQNPIFSFVLSEVKLAVEGILVNGTQTLKAGLNSVNAQFEDVLIRYDVSGLSLGRIVIADDFNLIVHATGNPNIGFAITTNDEIPEDLQGAVISVEGPVAIDSTGLSLSGTTTAAMKFNQTDLPEIGVEFKNDFLFSSDPFNVVNGQADFLYNDLRVAWLDASGLHPDLAFFNLIDPDRILLPVESVAYITLREDNEWLLDLEPQNDGKLAVHNIPGKSPKLVIPALQGNLTQPPSFNILLDNVVVDPLTMAPISGTITADVPGGDGLNLKQNGIPLNLHQIIFGDMTQGGIPIRGLWLIGDVMLFDSPIQTTEPARLLIASDRTVQGHLSLEGINSGFPISDNGMVRFSVESLQGSITVPGGIPALTQFDIYTDGRFDVVYDSETVLSASANIRIQPGAITVNSFSDGEGSGSGSIDMNGFFLNIDRLKSLNLNYQSETGFDFYSALGMSFGFKTDEEIFMVPVQGVALHTEGFQIPAQERHQHSQPAFLVPGFNLQGIYIKPLAARIPAIELTWNDLESANITGFLPRFDFEISFPGFNGLVPALTDAKVTLADAGLTDGIISGMVIPYTFAGNGVSVPLAAPALNPPVFRVETIGGGLERIETLNGPSQRVNIEMSGELANLPSFNLSGNEGCSNPQISVRLASALGFEGTVSSLIPCGTVNLGMVDLNINQASAEFSFSDNVQSILLQGDVTAWLPSTEPGGSKLGVNGSLGIDLMTGNIKNGAIEIAEPFLWSVPAPESEIFNLTVNQARLDASGLSLQGQSVIVLGNSSIGVSLNNFLYSFNENRFISGSAQIDGGFGLEIELAGHLHVNLVNITSPFTLSNALRLNSEAGVTLDHEGLKLTGSSTAALRFADQDYEELTIEYVQDANGPFTLRPNAQSLPIIQVTNGRADLILGSSRIAWYDSDGIHFDDVMAAIPIPDRIGLPTEDIAYLQLRNEQGELVVETENITGGYTLRTKQGETVDLVLAGFDNQAPPRIALEFELSVNDAFMITSGEIAVELGSNPLNMQPFTGLPIGLKSIYYGMDSVSNTFRLQANAGLKLPGDLEPIELIIEELLFDSQGFKQIAFTAGNFSEIFDPNVSPIASLPFGQGDTEIFNLMGVKLEFGQQNMAAISGTLVSSFLQNTSGNEPFPLFYYGTWSEGPGSFGGSWDILMAFETGQELPIGLASLALEEITAILDDEKFNVTLSGQLSVPNLMGSSFKVKVEDLNVGTRGISLSSAEIIMEQHIDLFDGMLSGNISRLKLEIDNNRVFYTSGDGELELLGHPMEFTDMRVGTDGSFSIAQADLLPGDEILALIPEVAWFHTLQLGVNNNRLSLTSGGSVVLPEPMNATSDISFGLTYNDNGEVNIDGPNIALIFGEEGDSYNLGDSPLTEVEIGDLATLALTGLAMDLDLYDISYTKFYGTAIVFMENENNKRINFGDSGQIRDEPGIFMQRDSQLEWNVSSHGTNLFSFDAGFFRLQIDGVRTFDPTVFGLELDGLMSIVIGGDDSIFDGTTGFANMQIAMPENPQIDPNPIKRWPDFNGISVTIMDIIALELGVFDFGIDQSGNGVAFTIEEGDDPDNIVETTIMVKEYLRFYNPLEGASAVSISLTEAFSGGVEEILIYRDIHDTFLLHIKNADLALSSVGSLNINFRLLMGEGQFSLLAAGGGNITGLGGLAAAGKFGIVDQGPGQIPLLSFGVFFAIKSDTPIPLVYQAPPAIGLSGIGGGFFFRPEAVDLDAVYCAVGAMDEALGFMLEQRGLPPSDANFAVMAYAAFVMVGQGPISAYEGSMFLELTDNYINMTAAGSVIKQGASLTAGLTGTLNWSNLSLSGRMAAKIGYDPVLFGEGDLGFTLTINVPQTRLDWVVDGGLEANVVGIPATGSLVISPDGLYADLNVNANYSLAVVSLNGNFTIRNWIIPNYSNPENSELGAFAQVDISASLPGASVNALANGTFLVKNMKTSLYTLAEASVEVMFIGNAKIWVFAEFRDGNLADAGILNEVDGKFAEMLEEANNLANEMNSKAENAKNSVNNADQIFDTSLSDDILASAGQNYLILQQAAETQILGIAVDATVLSYETQLFTPFQNSSVPSALLNVNTEIKNDNDLPNRNDVDNAGNTMVTRLASANATGKQVIQTIDQTTAQAVEWLAQTELNLENLSSPVETGATGHQSNYGGFNITGSVPFSVNTETAAGLQNAYTQAAESEVSFADREGDYLQAIASTEENLNKMNTILNGSRHTPGVISQGHLYSLARQSVGEYFARKASYFHEQHRWADRKHQMLLDQENSIQSAVISTRSAMNNLNNSVAADRCDYLKMAIDLNINCNDRYSLGQLVATKRREAVLTLSGMSPSQINQNLATLNSTMTTLRNQNNINEFGNRFRETGNEYWFESLNLGLNAYKNEALSKANSVNGKRTAKLEPLSSAHGSFTQALDSLFVVKAKMTENLYAMIDAYLEARAMAQLPMSTSQVTDLINKRQKLANSLLPPVINSLTVNQTLLRESKPRIIGSGLQYRSKYVNRANIYWSASHPVQIQEYSAGIRRGQFSNIGSGHLFSNGKQNQLYNWSHKGYTEPSGTTGLQFLLISTEPSTTIDYTVTVRARGDAGYTSSRSVVYEAVIEGSNNWTLSSQPVQSTTQLPGSTATPSQPAITLNGAYPSSGGSQSIPAFWWHQSNRLDLTLQSSDPESGINRFEIAIGTSILNQNILPWTTVTGTRETSGNTVKVNAIIRNLNLIQGSSFNFIQVRAVNGAGTISQIKQIRIRVDDTPPQLVVPATLAQNNLIKLSSNLNESLTKNSLSNPDLSSGSRNLINFASNPEFHTIDLPEFTDPESGIKKIEYVVSGQAMIPYAKFEKGETIIATGTGIDVQPSYSDSSYVYLRAENGAGLHSNFVVISYKTRDLTNPTTPNFITSLNTQGLMLEFISESSDPETGVKGYRYAIGSTPGADDIRSWLPLNEIDFKPEDLMQTKLSRYIMLPNNILPMQREFYISIRALNGQNRLSANKVSGPIYISNTQPGFKDVKVKINNEMISLGGYAVDTVAVRSVSYRIRDKINGEILNEGSINIFRPNPEITLNTSIALKDAHWRHSLSLMLTAENTSGLTKSLNQDILVNPAVLEKMSPPSGVTVNDGIGVSNMKIISWNASASPYLRRYEIIRRDGDGINVIGEADKGVHSFTYNESNPSSAVQYGVRAIAVSEHESVIVYPRIIVTTTTPRFTFPNRSSF